MEKNSVYGFNLKEVMIMKRHFKKQLAFLLILCTIVSWAAPSLAAKSVNMPYVIHETVDSQYLGSGIKYENIKKFTSKGWWNINVVRVDLTDEYAEIKGLMNNKGLSNTTTVTDMVNQQKAVAGVNGDFFSILVLCPILWEHLFKMEK